MILVAVLPLMAAMAAAIHRERIQVVDAAGLQVEDLARRAALRYQEVLLESRTLLDIVAFVPEVIHGTAETCGRFLSQIERTRPWAEGLMALDPHGIAVCSTTPGGTGLDLSDRAYYRQAMAERRFVVGDFISSRVTGSLISITMLPVLNDEGAVTRLIGAVLLPTWLEDLARQLPSSSEVSLWLIDRTGTAMASYRSGDAPPDPAPIDRDSLQALMRTPGGWIETAPPGGPARIYGVVEVPQSGARIVAAVERAKVLARTDLKIGRGAVISAVALAIAMMLALGLARRIADPLVRLTEGANAARRFHDVDLPEVRDYAEVESLSRSLQALLHDNRRREQALRDARAEAERASADARAAHERLREAIEAVPVGLAFFDADDRFVLWNRLYEDLYAGNPLPLTPGMRFEERLRARLKLGLIPPAVGREEEWLAERMASFRAHAGSHVQRMKGNRWLRVEERRTSDGGSIGIRIDITDLKRSEQSFRLLFDANPVPMWVFDSETLRFLAVNDAAVTHYGYSREQFLTMTLLDLRDPADHDAIRASARSPRCARGERVWRHRRADGSEILIQAYTRVLAWEGRPAKLGALIDITQRWRDEAHIRHLAHYDGLTELANRTLFRARLEHAIGQPRTPGRGIALICIDLDGFKDVNDTLGHPVGDRLLKQVADRLRECVRDQDTAARIGGDEFAVIQDGIAAADDARGLAERLITVISAPYVIDGHEITVTPSVGIATTLEEGSRAPDELLNHADMALYRAKARGRRSYCFFETEMDVQLRARRTLEVQLRAAHELGQFEVHYQPWVDLRTGRIDGFEALLRWTDPERGPVSPAEFIPLAENIGLIVPLGEWVLQRACADAARWPAPIKLAVNLSPVQFRSGDIVQTVQAVLGASGFDPARIELEITETVLLEDNATNLSTLHALRALGVHIAMDDFGTGYSSIGYLRRFPFDKIKIDRSFVSELPNDIDCLTITRGVAELAAGLGMSTIAEGVETVEQQEILRAIGCTLGQGYLFGRAMPAEAAEALLASRRTAAA
ncbi:EAL domain-containing protein [Rhodoplanes sp. TEM]|uniref:EAL domain-containing protein n=1 Tax=Rhodoplanes tepidamans TaxID=200616 RepID=A0ABT5JBL9_RHOTP|nr:MULTISPECIES: EAL domain-containing protein [Rhodoplanes]MDC7786843.1 EAL domain-containing protein [Rhodoplanes tepidamans]MDC7984228.1 EAL domain-containing protein [Rhodoplanes sp. TEM]MDQ0355971.1 diguanylate cyclase (GGDEF)-like protein/PAS domain S-box-containing protein [Rhodoplanes tepidamans]